MTPRGVDELRDAVSATGLLRAAGDRPLLLLCSAGRDSACLLDLAVDAVGVHGLVVLHVDHGLREASAAEAEELRAAMAARGVAVQVRRAGAAPASGNLHAWARAERARLAEAVAREVGAGAVASAHTRSDLVETALYRLATQPGRRALLAMREREASAIAPGVDLVRPLLGLGRDETMAWCVARGLPWRDDPSNADRRFARARLRHTVTPVLRGLNPRHEEAIVRTLHELAEERAALEALVLEALPLGQDALDVTTLEAMPLALARLVVRELCERQVGGPCARAGARTAELIERALADPSPFQLDVGDGARLAVRGGVVRCISSSGPAAPVVQA